MADQAPPPPQWAPPPPQQPGWGAPPPGAWGQPGYSAPPPRPIGVTLSAVLFFVIGVLLILGAVFLFAGGALLEGAFGGDARGVFAGIGAVFGVIVLIIAILYLLIGWGLVRGNNAARIGGIIFGVLGVLAGISSLTGGSGSLVYGIILIVLWGFVVWALFTAGPYFSYRR